MTQDERWQSQYDQMMAFMKTNHRRPSKHRVEEHNMLSWFKSNKKQIAPLFAEVQPVFAKFLCKFTNYC